MKKLDIRGVAHEVLIVAFVVVFAIAGVGYMVASHADPCPPGEGAVSGNGCDLSPPGVICSIVGLPETGTYQQTVKPILQVVNNNGRKIKKITVTMYTVAYGPKGSRTLNKKSFVQGLSPVAMSMHDMRSYKVPYASSKTNYIVYQGVLNHSTVVNCAATMKLPVKP